jgi:hypothetical protein
MVLEVPAPGVPEASTWAMMLLGFAGLSFAGYRASRSQSSRSGRRPPKPSAKVWRSRSRNFFLRKTHFWNACPHVSKDVRMRRATADALLFVKRRFAWR